MPQLSLRRDLGGGDPADGVRQVAEDRGAPKPYSVRALLGGSFKTGVFWRGFTHRWEYNHRLNRFGSYVRPREEGWVVGHTAASGSGPDTAHFEDHFTTVRAPGVRFVPYPVGISVTGSEVSEISFAAGPRITLDTPLDDGEVWTVVLNGFDISAQADADKLIHFDARIDDRTASDDGGEVGFTVKGSFEAACRTPECETGDDRVDYELNFHCLLIRGDADTLTIGGTTYARNAYQWDVGGPDTEIHSSNRGSASASVENADGDARRDLLAFESISMDIERLDRSGINHPALMNAEAVHLLGWDTVIERLTRVGDDVTTELLLFFKNWRWGMKSANPPASRFALRDAGRARFDVALRLLQFDTTDVYDPGEQAGTIDWQGQNADPNSPDARDESTVPVN